MADCRSIHQQLSGAAVQAKLKLEARIEQLEAQNKELREALELAKPHVEFAVRMSMPNSRAELAIVNAALSAADKGEKG